MPRRENTADISPELIERAKQMYPLLSCPDVPEKEFLLWYDLQTEANIFYLEGRGKRRMEYVSGHVRGCQVCRERYENMQRVTDFFTTIFATRPLRVM